MLKLSYLILTTIIFSVVLPLHAEEGKEKKIAVISLQTIFEEYRKSQEASETLKRKADALSLQRRERINDLKALESEVKQLEAEARDSSLNKAECENKERLAQEKNEELRTAEEKVMEFNERSKERIALQMRERQEEIVVEIRKAIEKYVKKHDITLVLDCSGKSLNAVENVIYFDETHDITFDIIKILNNVAPEGKNQ